ncbi:uncharacterized protein LOC143461153 [Clavelina lepadiformis]|uniref:RRM domain-containing protein n=1 Tax=Clavelina lepadiformis TaxID=159417 RepID=A0ABP0GCD1_CLALP
MDRFGRSNYRGGGPMKPYGTRPVPNARSSLLGAGPGGPSFRSPSQYGSGGNQQSSREWPAPRSSSAQGSLLGQPLKRTSQYDSGHYGHSNTAASSGRTWVNEPTVNEPVPTEVRQLMHTLGLSQSDMEKLSQLPETELSSVNNLARAIGDLRQEKQVTGRAHESQYGGSESSGMSNQSGSYGRRGSFQERDGRGSFGRAGESSLMGDPPSGGRNSFGPNSKSNNYGSNINDSNQQYNSPAANRHKPTGIKVTVKPSDRRGLPSDGSGYYDPKLSTSYPAQRPDRSYNEYYDDKQYYGRDDTANRYDQRNDSFSESSRRINNNSISQREGKPHGYGNERRVAPRDRGSDAPATSTPRSLSRPVGTRNLPKSSTTPSSSHIHNQPPPRGGGLLGNPLQPNAHGLESLAASVGRTPSTVSMGASQSLLNPMVISQAEPTILEAQLHAMQAIQAQAIKIQDKPSYYDSSSSSNREKERPRRRSPGRSGGIDRRLEEEARKEAQEMRSMRGRVLYIRYKSPRVEESDLRQLATAFGKVTNLLVINPKVKNGHYQAFMEMEQWDCAAAMLEHYMARSPCIRGSPIEVQRSNYRDLQIRSDLLNKERGNKRVRSRSISPIRKGTTQLPHKRERRSREREKKPDDKPKPQTRKSAEKLNVSISTTSGKSERRIVTRTQDDSRSNDSRDARNDTKKNEQRKAESKKIEPKKADNKKVDAREIINRTRSRDHRSDSRSSDTHRRSTDSYRRSPQDRLRKRSPADRRSTRRTSDEPKDKVRRLSQDKGKKTEEKVDESEKKAIVTKANGDEPDEEKKTEDEFDKNKEEIDPLDVIADELALHDEFALMDEVQFDGEQNEDDKDGSDKKQSSDVKLESKDEEEKKIDPGTDLECPDLDLENLNVEIGQDEDNLEKRYDKNVTKDVVEKLDKDAKYECSDLNQKTSDDGDADVSKDEVEASEEDDDIKIDKKEVTEQEEKQVDEEQEAHGDEDGRSEKLESAKITSDDAEAQEVHEDKADTKDVAEETKVAAVEKMEVDEIIPEEQKTSESEKNKEDTKEENTPETESEKTADSLDQSAVEIDITADEFDLSKLTDDEQKLTTDAEESQNESILSQGETEQSAEGVDSTKEEKKTQSEKQEPVKQVRRRGRPRKKVQPPPEVEVEKKVQPPPEVKIEKKVQPPPEVKAEKNVQPPAEVEVEKKVQPLAEVEVEKKVQPPPEVEVEKKVQPSPEVEVETPPVEKEELQVVDDLKETQDMVEDEEELADNGVMDAESDEDVDVDESKAAELQSVIGDSLKEVLAAKEHLQSLTKVTKNKAAQTIAKKLKVCLDVAITRLQSADST